MPFKEGIYPHYFLYLYFKYSEIQLKACEYPVFFVIEHIYNWIGRESFCENVFKSNASLSSSSLTANGLSTLFPKMQIGIFASSGVFTTFSSSSLASGNLFGSAESTKKIMPSTAGKYSFQIFLAVSWPPKSNVLNLIYFYYS